MALALNKKIFLHSENGKEFGIKNTAGFYWHPNLERIIGSVDLIVEKIKIEK